MWCICVYTVYVCLHVCLDVYRGVHPHWGHDAFPPCFRFPPYFRKIFTVENFLNLTFSRIFFGIFIRQFRWPFFSHRPQIFKFPPIFPVSVPPCFAKIIISPYFDKFPLLLFEKFTCFLHTLCVFSFPPTLTMMHLCIIQCAYWTPLEMI